MNKNIIFIISVQNDERSKNQSHYHSILSWNKWAHNNNAEVFVLDETILNPPQWNKALIFRLLEANNIEYDRILYVDADTIVHPDMPNIFEELEYGYFYGIRNYGSMDWVIRSIENYSHYIFNGFNLSWNRYINSGVMLFDKTHREFFEWLIKFNEENHTKLREVEKLGVGKDQPVINFGLAINNVPFRELPYEYNMQDMMRFEVLGGEDMLHTKYGWIYHFNAGVQPTPEFWMKRTYEYLWKTT